MSESWTGTGWVVISSRSCCLSFVCFEHSTVFKIVPECPHYGGTGAAPRHACVIVKRGGAQPKVSALPWWLTALAAPFVPTLREPCEMRYLWTTRVEMSNAKLVAVLEAALVGMGCLAK